MPDQVMFHRVDNSEQVSVIIGSREYQRLCNDDGWQRGPMPDGAPSHAEVSAYEAGFQAGRVAADADASQAGAERTDTATVQAAVQASAPATDNAANDGTAVTPKPEPPARRRS